MKKSRYNFLFTSKKGENLLYNSASNSFLSIDEGLFNALKRNELGNISKEDVDELKKVNVIVENETDDERIILEQKAAYYLNSFNQNQLGLAIAPTMSCNFDCHYCYEGNNKMNKSMSDKTIDKLIEFIKSYNNISGLNITWYGGEPLLGIKKIKKIHNEIIKMNLPILNHGMVTNGFLLKDKNISIIKNLNLDFIQITFDGLPETHNTRRTHKNKKIKTFNPIMDNIETFLEKCPETNVLIRIHVDKETTYQFPILYNRLKEKWAGKNVHIYPGFLHSDVNSCSSSCSTFSDQRDLFDFYSDLYKKHDLKVDFFPQFSLGGCTATNINGYVVGPEGELYKCWNDIGISSKVVGFVDSHEIFNKTNVLKYLVHANKYEDSNCKSCKIFPICSGGCPYYRVENNITGKDNYPQLCTINKSYIKDILELHYEQYNENTNRSEISITQ